MKRIENYLTRLAQEVWPGAVIFEVIEKGRPALWTLEGKGSEPIILGQTFAEARQGLDLLIKSEKRKTKTH